MSEKKPLFGMSQSDKARLLAGIRGAEKKASPMRMLTRPIDSAMLKFEEMSSYHELLIQKSVVKKLGIEEPYYRTYDAITKTHVSIGESEYLNFSCYDYLGLNSDARVLEAAEKSAKKYGMSASASRLTAGERPPHLALEKAIADLYSAEASIAFVSGHGTNVSTIACLFGPRDVIFYDSLSHNSLVFGAKSSEAARYSYPSNDMHALRNLLCEHRASFERALIVTEGLFGMDGCIADLPTLIALKKEFGAFLMVDEAHSMGVLGEHGCGVSEHFGIDPRDVDIWMGTLSKSFCGCGGYIAGSAPLIEILRYQAASFVYSVGMPPSLAAASTKAIELMREEPFRVKKLQENSQTMLRILREMGLDTGKAEGYAVVPVMVGDSLTCVLAADLLFKEGILVMPIIYPGVEEGKARLRFFLSQSHSPEQIREACEKTRECLPRARASAEAFLGKTRV